MEQSIIYLKGKVKIDMKMQQDVIAQKMSIAKYVQDREESKVQKEKCTRGRSLTRLNIYTFVYRCQNIF